MEKKVLKNYNDKWRNFIKNSLKNIDYLSFKMPDSIVTEISYCFEMITLKEGEYLFRKGET